MTGLPVAAQLSGAAVTLIVFGMGLGESILLRFEREDEIAWAVVDSARKKIKRDAINPALTVLEQAGAWPSLVVLTHPHRDHAKGMADLVDRAEMGALVGCVEPLMEPADELAGIMIADDVLANGIGEATLAHAAISAAWRDGRAQRLEIAVEAPAFTFCGWKVEILHPTRAKAQSFGDAVRQGEEPNLNNVSAAMLFSEATTSFLLAGDGEKEAWDELAARLGTRDLRAAHPLKAPHHGSFEALRPVVVDPTQPFTRTQVVTPFPANGQLPRLSPGEGAERLIQAGGPLHLTAMPVALLPSTSPLPLSTAHAAMSAGNFDGDTDIPTEALTPSSTSAFVAGDRDPRECWVMFKIDAAGSVTTTHGTHALTLT